DVPGGVLSLPIFVGGTLYRWIIVDLTSNRELQVSLNNHSLTYPTGQIIQTGKWYNLAASLDLSAGVLRLLLEGKRLLNQTLPGGFQLDVITQGVLTDKIVTLENYSNATAYKGLLDNLQIYSRALAAVPAITNMNPTQQLLSSGAVDVTLSGT